MNKDPHILVTGGLGFLGSHFINHLLTTHSSVRIFNLDSRPQDSAPSHLIPWLKDERYKHIHGDVTDSDLVEETVKVEVIDIIVNFAMITGRNRALQDPIEGVKVNVVGVASLLHVVEKYGIRLIQVGTDQVYGSIEAPGYANSTTLMSPTSHFAAEKAAADMLIRSSHKSHNSDVVITHACNVIGSYQHPNELIPYMITNSLDGKPVVLWEDGLQQRQLLYVQDYVTAMKLIVFKGEAGLVYNIGSQYEVTNLGIANSILGITRQTGLPIHYSNPPFVYDRRHALDFDALRDLGWKAIYSLEESLQQTVQWYRENRSWWASIKVQGKVL